MHTNESPAAPSQEVVSPQEPPEAARRLPGRRRRWAWLLGCILSGGLVVACVWMFRSDVARQWPELSAWLDQRATWGKAWWGRLGLSTPGGEKVSEAPVQGATPAMAPVNRAIPVVAAMARRGPFPIYLTGLGSVTAFNTVTVRTRVDGQLVRIAFQEGQMVRQGDVLGEIDPRPFQVQLAQAEGQMARDEAQLNNAKVDLERYRVLLAQDSVARQQLDTQRATVQQLEGVLKSDQAQIDNARLLLTYTRITAPISGRIGLRLVDQGNMVRTTDQHGLAVITQVQPIAVLFGMPADDLPQVLPKLQAGQQLTVEAYNRDLQQKLATGMLLTSDNQIDPSTGTLRCKAVFPNHDSTLFPNQFVNIRLLVEAKQDVITIPAAAIQRRPQATQAAFVYLIKDNTVEVRDVVPGPTEGAEVVVTSGLAPGEVVIIEGVDRVQRGTKVAARMVGDGPVQGKP